MAVGLILGWALVIAAVASLGVHFGTGGAAIGEVWSKIDANSLVGLQSFVEKRLDPNPEEPTLYFDVVLPALEMSFWGSLATLSAILAALVFVFRAVRRNRRRHRFH